MKIEGACDPVISVCPFNFVIFIHIFNSFNFFNIRQVNNKPFRWPSHQITRKAIQQILQFGANF